MAGGQQVSGRKAFLRQVATMGWSVELLPSRRHLKFTKASSTIIAPIARVTRIPHSSCLGMSTTSAGGTIGHDSSCC